MSDKEYTPAAQSVIQVITWFFSKLWSFTWKTVLVCALLVGAFVGYLKVDDYLNPYVSPYVERDKFKENVSVTVFPRSSECTKDKPYQLLIVNQNKDAPVGKVFVSLTIKEKGRTSPIARDQSFESDYILEQDGSVWWCFDFVDWDGKRRTEDRFTFDVSYKSVTFLKEMK